MFTRLSLTSLIIFFLLNINISAYDRVVLLSPAAGDIFKQLHLEDKVVGITRHMQGFKYAKKVGSHLRPNIEIIKSLHPDLIVISSVRFFSKALNKNIETKYFNYNPHTLDGIIRKIKDIGEMFKKDKEANILIENLNLKLENIKQLKKTPKVVYEVMQMPYIVVGKTNIISDIICKAGGINIVTVNKKHVKYSYEKVVAAKPDIYLYQVGPMNKNPVPPGERKYFKTLNAMFVKIDERSFARPNTKSFENVLKLNKIFKKWGETPVLKKLK